MRRIEEPEYTEKYMDDEYEYRQVLLPRKTAGKVSVDKLLTEKQCIELGIRQSKGWVHYGFHKYEPYILLFKRKIGTDPQTGTFNKRIFEEHKKMVEFERLKCLEKYCK